MLEEIGERLSCSKALLQLWQRYKELYEQSCRSVQLQEEKADKLLKLACSKDIADEEVSDWIQECSVSLVFGKVWFVYALRPSAEYLISSSECIVCLKEVLRAQVPAQASLQVLQELGEQLKQQVDTSAASAIQSDHVSLTGRLAAVEQALTRQLTTLQVDGEKAPSQTSQLSQISCSTSFAFAFDPRLESRTMRFLTASWIHWDAGLLKLKGR